MASFATLLTLVPAVVVAVVAWAAVALATGGLVDGLCCPGPPLLRGGCVVRCDDVEHVREGGFLDHLELHLQLFVRTILDALEGVQVAEPDVILTWPCVLCMGFQ